MNKKFVIGDFDAAQWAIDQAEKERARYAAATAGDDSAAAELHFWQTKFGRLEARDVENAIRTAELEARFERLKATTTPNRRDGREWHHLDAFGVATPSTRPKSPAKLLELHHAHGIMLTTNDLRLALTTIFDTPGKASKKPRRPSVEWAETVGDVEETLVVYVRYKFKGASEEAARVYVRDSFPGLPCKDEPDAVVDYPADW